MLKILKIKIILAISTLTLWYLKTPRVNASHSDAGGVLVPEHLKPTYAPDSYYKDYRIDDIWYIVGDIVKILLSITGMITVFLIAKAGFQYVTSGGKQEAIDNAKNSLKWSFIGFIAVLFSYVIVDFLIERILQLSGNP